MSNKNQKSMSLLALALPLLVEQILRNLMGTVNTFMLSRISDDASAAVGVAIQILNVIQIVQVMASAGAAVLINQYLGAGRDEDAGKVSMNAVTVICALGLLFGGFTAIFARPMIVMVGLEERLLQDAVIYLRIVGSLSILPFASYILATIFRCHGKVKTTMTVIIINNLVNLAGSEMVLRGILPITGITGIAIVRMASEAVGVVLLTVLLMRESWNLKRYDLFHLNFTYVKTTLKLGFMSGVEGICYTLAQLVTTSYATTFTAATLSAKVYTQTVNNYAYQAGLAVGCAAQIIVGHMIGAGREEEAHGYIKRAWVYVLSCNIVFSLLFIVFSNNLIGLFTDSAEILAIAKVLLFVDLFSGMGRSFSHSYNYGLRAAGYVFWPMIVSAVFIWATEVGLGYVLALPAGLGILGIWIAQAVDEWARGLCVCYLWISKKWMNRKL